MMPIPGRSRPVVLAVRALLALFVAWGSIVEITGAYTFTNDLATNPGTSPATGWPYKYTFWREVTTVRGWPLEFTVQEGPPTWARLMTGIRPGALLCDLIVAGALVFAAWTLLDRPRRQFSLAGMFALTTSVALALSFHLVAWKTYFAVYDRRVGLSRLAVDVGAFCAAFVVIRAGRRLAAKRRHGKGRTGSRDPEGIVSSGVDSPTA
jgi:hypothetical protein